MIDFGQISEADGKLRIWSARDVDFINELLLLYWRKSVPVVNTYWVIFFWNILTAKLLPNHDSRTWESIFQQSHLLSNPIRQVGVGRRTHFALFLQQRSLIFLRLETCLGKYLGLCCLPHKYLSLTNISFDNSFIYSNNILYVIN